MPVYIWLIASNSLLFPFLEIFALSNFTLIFTFLCATTEQRIGGPGKLPACCVVGQDITDCLRAPTNA